MKNKKVIILIIVAVVALFSLIYGIVTPSKVRREAASKKPIVFQKSESLAPAKKITTAKRVTRRTNYTSWGRSPFLLKRDVVKTVAGFTLNGILWDEEAPQAIINDNVVGIGDEIRGNTVVDIKEDRVVFSDGYSNFELEIGP